MLALGGATYLGGLSYYISLYITFGVFMCDTLLCIHRVFTCYALNYIYVIVISTWSWYMACVLSILNHLYVISLVLCSFAFASAFYSDANELYYLYSCLFHIFWVHYVGLVCISMANSFCSYCLSAYMNQACWKPHPSLIHILEVVLSSITKRGRLKASRPLSWISMINDNTKLLWLTCVLQRQLS